MNIQDLFRQAQRQNAFQRLGAFGSGMLQHNPLEPTTFWNQLGRAGAAAGRVPQQNPLRQALMGMQLQAAQRKTAADNQRQESLAAVRSGVQGTGANAYQGATDFGPTLGPQEASAQYRNSPEFMGDVLGADPRAGLAALLKPGMTEFQKQSLALREKALNKPSRALEAVGVGGSYNIPTADGSQEVQAYFDKRRKGHFYKDSSGVEQPLPFGSKRLTPSSELHDKMKPKQWLDLKVEMNADRRSLRNLARYVKTINKGGQGLDLLADKITATYKTLFAPYMKDGKLDTSEFATVEGKSRLQSLLGQFRLETVGPGVMTEFDAQRVIWAMGGDVSALRNPAVAKKILRDVMEEKAISYNEKLDVYNRQGKKHSAAWTERKPIAVDESLFGARDETAPKAGEVIEEDGRRYRFKGGDPADQNSWEVL